MDMYMVMCVDGTLMYEYGESEHDVRSFMVRCYPHLQVQDIELAN